jgi:hypothetical protein
MQKFGEVRSHRGSQHSETLEDRFLERGILLATYSLSLRASRTTLNIPVLLEPLFYVNHNLFQKLLNFTPNG